ncbi:hypothetical protein [Psychrobacillus sp. OK032]|nr:hypothetical protein [Psychrobacillus sp. OK032]SES46449.1 hypothetical protein SAMN05518872_1287 [Psychrobacillus sp. OK032]
MKVTKKRVIITAILIFSVLVPIFEQSFGGSTGPFVAQDLLGFQGM